MLGGAAMQRQAAFGMGSFGIHFQGPDMAVAPVGKEVGPIQISELAAAIGLSTDNANAFST